MRCFFQQKTILRADPANLLKPGHFGENPQIILHLRPPFSEKTPCPEQQFFFPFFDLSPDPFRKCGLSYKEFLVGFFFSPPHR